MMTRRLSRRLARIWGAVLCSGLGIGSLAEPAIQHFAPHALAPGGSVTVTFSGSKLNDVTGLWTSFGGTSRRLNNENLELVSFEVNCPPDASGIGALQLAGPSGLSDYQLIAADDLPVQSHRDDHQSIGKAHRLNPPAAVDCILKSEAADYYVFKGKAGETFSIEIVANRLGSQMDSIVKVLDGRGNELAFCDDEPGISRDSRFHFTCAVEGDYYLMVHDVGYGGGPAFDYRLRIGSFAVDRETFPADAIWAGPSVQEKEPNNAQGEAQQIGFPAIIRGKLEHGLDLDQYRFLALKDQKLAFQSATRSINSPCDLNLRILKMDGTSVAESDPRGAGEAALTNRFSEAGMYLLEVRELSGNSSSNLPYIIRAAPFAPGFNLEAENARFSAEPGGAVTFKVNCERFDFPGAIEIEMRPAVEGISLENNIIGEGKSETDLRIIVAAEWQAGSWCHFRLEGKAAADGQPVIRDVGTGRALNKIFPLLSHAPASVRGLFSLGIRKGATE